MAEQDAELRRRRLLLAATSVAGGAAAAAAGVPFVASMMPSERAKAAGAPVNSISAGLEPGQKVIVEWRGKPETVTPYKFVSEQKLIIGEDAGET